MQHNESFTQTFTEIQENALARASSSECSAAALFRSNQSSVRAWSIDTLALANATWVFSASCQPCSAFSWVA